MVARVALTMAAVTLAVAGCSVRLTDDGPWDKKERVRRFLEAAHSDRRELLKALVSPKLLAEAPLEAIIERVRLVEEVEGAFVGVSDRFQFNEQNGVTTVDIEVRFQRGTTKGSFRFDRE